MGISLKHIKTKPVEGSSNILGIGYDPPSSTLRVVFRTGGAYDFLDVTPETHASFMDAPSYGVYFAANIKGKFPGVKVASEYLNAVPAPAT